MALKFSPISVGYLRSWKISVRFICLCVWLYIMACFVSFEPQDPSYFSTSYPTVLTKNYGGLVGSWFVAWVLHTLGFSGVITCATMIGLLFQKSKKLTCAFMISVPCCVMFVSGHFQWQMIYDGYPFLYGGSYGLFLSQKLIEILGFMGFLVINVIVFIIPWFFCFDFNFFEKISLLSFYRRGKISREYSKEVRSQKREEEVQKSWSGPKQLLNKSEATSIQNRSELDQTSQRIVEILKDFNIEGEVIGYECGPVVATYHFQLAPGVRKAKVQTVADDLALCLQVESIFISALAEKKSIGIQIPHHQRELVCLGDLVDVDGLDQGSPLLFCLGKAASGRPVMIDMIEMPHLLIAGATGSGKSVGINALLISLLMRSSPEDLKMILIDPKQLELAMYEGVPHLMMPVLTEPEKATVALRWVVKEMERRYSVLHQAGVRNIQSFRTNPSEPMPYLLVVIDELADLMLTGCADIELLIQRLAQKARACGIHMVLATQRPSVDVITGVIKANLPSRIAYQVFSRHDSRTILDQIGAENLLGKGDMLLMTPGKKSPERVQSAFVSDEEVLKVVSELKKSEPQNDIEAIQWIDRYKDPEKKSKKQTQQIQEPL